MADGKKTSILKKGAKEKGKKTKTSDCLVWSNMLPWWGRLLLTTVTNCYFDRKAFEDILKFIIII